MVRFLIIRICEKCKFFIITKGKHVTNDISNKNLFAQQNRLIGEINHSK